MNWMLVALLLLPLQCSAASLNGLRWFDHQDYVRVVFDLSETIAYRISDSKENGYVELILEGTPGANMRPRVEFDSPWVDFAEQKHKTSNSLIWRLHVKDVRELRHFSLGDSPFKIVVDLYKSGMAGPAPTEVSITPVVAESPKKSKKQHSPAKKKAAPKKPAADQNSPSDAWADVQGSAQTHLKVASLLLELDDPMRALTHIESADTTAGVTAGSQLLAGIAWMRIGDLFRARRNLEMAHADKRYRSRAAELLGRIKPDDKGVLTGGDILEEDLEYYLRILRRGHNLDYPDLASADVQQDQAATGFASGLLLGGAIAALGALAGFIGYRRRQESIRRRRILKESASTEAAPLKQRPAEYEAEVNTGPPSQQVPQAEPLLPKAATEKPVEPEEEIRPPKEDLFEQVQAELAKHLEQTAAEAAESQQQNTEPLPVVDEGATEEESEAADEGEDLSVEVYRLADSNMPIVEIAETLGMGEDEVKLILDLRPQLPEA